MLSEEIAGNLDEQIAMENDAEPLEHQDAEKTDAQILEAMAAIEKKSKPKAPQPKLDEARLTGPEGLPKLPGLFAGFQRREKDEFARLDEVMGRLEHWAHCLFPKAAFPDFLARAEHLGHKKAVHNCLNRLRLGQSLTDPDFDPARDDDKEEAGLLEGSPPHRFQAESRTPSPIFKDAPAPDEFPDDAEMDELLAAAPAQAPRADEFPEEDELDELLSAPPPASKARVAEEEEDDEPLFASRSVRRNRIQDDDDDDDELFQT